VVQHVEALAVSCALLKNDSAAFEIISNRLGLGGGAGDAR
jgi:hypothetical protein